MLTCPGATAHRTRMHGSMPPLRSHALLLKVSRTFRNGGSEREGGPAGVPGIPRERSAPGGPRPPARPRPPSAIRTHHAAPAAATARSRPRALLSGIRTHTMPLVPQRERVRLCRRDGSVLPGKRQSGPARSATMLARITCVSSLDGGQARPVLQRQRQDAVVAGMMCVRQAKTHVSGTL